MIYKLLDINECDTGAHNCNINAECTDLPNDSPNGFSCACKDGFRGNGLTCEDINECTEYADICDTTKSTCLNLFGSFECNCHAGADCTIGMIEITSYY